MKVSLNTVKQYIDFDLPPVDELVARVNAQLGGVEKVIDLGVKYKDAKIVKVVECEKHPNADKLSVCKIDAGTGELVQVVCGAPNVRVGIWAVWLPPESTVPSTYDDKEPFVLGARELRGVLSQGMLAAGDELAINSDHDGILEINADEWRPYDAEIAPGASFADVFGLNDTIIDIENKMFTHRPDLFGQLGVAREIAGILGHTFESPSWYLDEPSFENGDGLALDVFNDAGEKVPRIMFVAMKNVAIKPSPLWLQCALVAMGAKPINNVVDATNYIMLLTAQPTHAYDYDKLRGKKIGARMAQDGEKVSLLNGKTYELNEDDIVIADGEGAIGLAGIMGGGNSEVSADTKNIVLEVATFDMYTVRKSAMRHGVFTDALARFNKGQSPLQNDRILQLLMNTMQDVSGAAPASAVVDLKTAATQKMVEGGEAHESITLKPSFIRQRLGLSISKLDMVQLLGSVEFPLCEDCGWEPGDDDASIDDSDLHITAPFWRTDIELPEDVVEEIGRLYGFDKLPRELPARSIQPAPKNAMRELKRRVRESLSRAGANEVLTYSFVHENVLRRAGQNPEHAYRLGNALSPDLQYYRLSLTPSLLDKIHRNIRAGHGEFALFELGKTHFKGEMDEAEPDVPNEDNHLAFVLAYGDKQKPAGSAFYAAKHYFADMFDLEDAELLPLEGMDLSGDEWGATLVAAYDPRRSAVIVRGDEILGVVGEFTLAARRAFKLPEFCAGFEVRLCAVKAKRPQYQPLSKFPSITQDISLKVPADVPYKTVYKKAWARLADSQGDLHVKLEPRSIYRADEAAPEKTITLRASVASQQRTLKDGEVQAMLDDVAQAVLASS